MIEDHLVGIYWDTYISFQNIATDIVDVVAVFSTDHKSNIVSFSVKSNKLYFSHVNLRSFHAVCFVDGCCCSRRCRDLLFTFSNEKTKKIIRFLLFFFIWKCKHQRFDDMCTFMIIWICMCLLLGNNNTRHRWVVSLFLCFFFQIFSAC